MREKNRTMAIRWLEAKMNDKPIPKEVEEWLDQRIRKRKIKSERAKVLSHTWFDLRYEVLRRDQFTCQACGARPPKAILHVDHIKPKSKYPELEHEITNLQALCFECNFGKRDKDFPATDKTVV